MPVAAEPCYRMLIHHNGKHYIAEVPELPGARATGQTYVEAAQHAQSMIADRLRTLRLSGEAPPLLNPTVLTRKIRTCLGDMVTGEPGRRRLSPAKQMLVDKYGKMANRDLAACIGLIERDAPLILSSAASGQGTRKARCAIAIALDIPPSQLWPDRAPALRQDDDALYRALTGAVAREPAHSS